MSKRFLAGHVLIALVVSVLLLAFEIGHFDHSVSSWFFDQATGRFPLRRSIMLETVMHLWAKYLVVLLGCSVAGAWLFSFAAVRLRPLRQVLLYLALALALAPAAVATLKTVGGQHCPHELIEFGGYAPYHGLLEREAPDVQAGRCFVSGHASAGFALFAFYFAGLALGRRRLARLGLWGGFSAGLVFGLTRVAQGSHFLSDVLWAGLACWVVSLVLYAFMFGFRSAAPQRPAAGPGGSESPVLNPSRRDRPPAMARTSIA